MRLHMLGCQGESSQGESSQGFSNFGEFVEPPKFKPHGFAGVAIGLFSKCCLDTAAGALAPSAVL